MWVNHYLANTPIPQGTGMFICTNCTINVAFDQPDLWVQGAHKVPNTSSHMLFGLLYMIWGPACSRCSAASALYKCCGRANVAKAQEFIIILESRGHLQQQ